MGTTLSRGTKKRERLTNLKAGRAEWRGLSDRLVKWAKGHSKPVETPQVRSWGDIP